MVLMMLGNIGIATVIATLTATLLSEQISEQWALSHHNGNYIGAPSGSSQVCAGDTLVIYGPLQRMEELDSRSTGTQGDQAHAAADKQYDEYLSEIQQEDVAATRG